MAQATSISLAKFTSSVQAAVKGSLARHRKFKVEPPNAISVFYLIRGFPVPDNILSNVTMGETQAFATEVATQIAAAHPEAALAVRGAAQEGAILSVGRHVIIGIPPISNVVQFEK